MPPSGDSSILILIACIVLIHSEQNLLAPNMSAVAASFGFDDAEKDEYLGGGLAVSLFLVGAPAALLIGMAADGWAKRSNLLALVLLLGAIGCGGSALSTTYTQLFLSRALTGVSLGGALPLAFSLLGDLAGPARRTALSGRLGLAMHAGTAGGQGLAGFVGPLLGWRVPFVLTASVMVLLSMHVRLRMVEPARAPTPHKREADKAGSTRLFGPHCAAWSSLFKIPTVWLVFLQGIPGCVPWGTINAFLPDYLHAEAGFTVQQATLIMSGFSLGGGIGTLLGGELGQRLYNRDRRWPSLLMLAAGVTGIFPLVVLIWTTPSSMLACALLGGLSGLFATQTGPNVRATLTNVTQTDQRGLAFASFALFDDLGRGAGPALIAQCTRRFGRRTTFAWSILGWLPCAMLNGATALTIRRDEVRGHMTADQEMHLPRRGLEDLASAPVHEL